MREIDLSEKNPDVRLAGALKSLADASATGAPPEIGNVLLGAFRRHHARRRAQRRTALAAAIGAVLLPAVLWVAARHPAKKSAIQPAAPAIVAPPVEAPAVPAVISVGPRRQVKKQRSRALVRQTQPAASDFVVLSSYYDQPVSGEELRIIRLEVTGNALRMVGVPVMEQRENRTVLADFVVGQDGTPYAMRLVR
jgi:hypothetical protein